MFRFAVSRSLRPICLLALLASVGASLPQEVSAQSQTVNSVPFHRFLVSYSNLGYLLTTDYQEGVNLGYVFSPFTDGGNLAVPPGPGWTPTPGQGLTPLYRWRVNQGGRIYYYYAAAYTQQGSGYSYQGVPGYMFTTGGGGRVPLYCYYSQNYGYWWTTGSENPPAGSFSYQGITGFLPTGGAFSFDPPYVPPDNDGDGYPADQDCNDYDSSIYPGAPIYCNSGEDRNCNGQDDYQECYGY